MNRQTQKPPYYFTVGKERFKTVKLGFLAAGEILLKYTPTLLDLYSEIKKKGLLGSDNDESVEVTINLAPILKTIPAGLLNDLSDDLLISTYSQDVVLDADKNPKLDDEGNYVRLETFTLVDSNNFEGIEEFAKVIFEVFKFNFPNFLATGKGTEGKSQPMPPVQEDFPTSNSKKKIRI